jgi:hypothetical protein
MIFLIFSIFANFTKMVKNGQKWSKMVKNGQKWSKMEIVKLTFSFCVQMRIADMHLISERK